MYLIDASSSRLQFVAVAGAIVILFAIVKLLFEFFQLVKLSFRYFLDWVNYLEIILFSCSILFAFIYLDTCFCPAKWQWQLGALCVFLAWIDLVIFARKLPVTGIYVVMLMNIFYIFLKLAFLAALLILSFAFSFYMLFHDPQNIINNIVSSTIFISFVFNTMNLFYLADSISRPRSFHHQDNDHDNR